MQKLIIGVTVGYMLKVLKSGTPITSFNDSFKAIRHGNYYDFITIIGEPIPFMISYNHGNIREETEPREDDIDFAGMIKAGPSLVAFYKKCRAIYGEIIDKDVQDEIFYKLVIFEIGLRMHANNNSLISKRDVLEKVINKISEYKHLPKEEIEVLQKGRRFLNMIKHNKKQFQSWQEGVLAFQAAFEIVTKHNMTII